MIVLPAAAAALNIDSPGLIYQKPRGKQMRFCEIAIKIGRKGEKEKIFSDQFTSEVCGRN
jgi:hypothetical protein